MKPTSDVRGPDPGAHHDAVVVGAGPNGLAAAITVAQAGRSVLLLEAGDTVGGGVRSAELTLPGFVHDVCAAVHPLALGSPFFSAQPLAEHGLAWAHPTTPLAHPLDDGSAAALERSIWLTAETLGVDSVAYLGLMGPLVAAWVDIAPAVLGPLAVPRHPLAAARFGLLGVRSALGIAVSRFRAERARALFAGLAAHSGLPLDRSPSAGVALVLGILGHAVGWPFARGGSQRIGDALAAHLLSLGGRIVTGVTVGTLADLPSSHAQVLDITPRQLLALADGGLPRRYRDALRRFEYGPGVFKLDWALEGPIPWRAKACRRAGTIHVGGTMEEIAAAEEAVWRGEHPDRPFAILAQPSLFDPTRAPAGKHTAWAYCHVPNGSREDMADRIEGQVERFAPGFRDLILGRNRMGPAELEAHDANYVGGDIGGGAMTLRQVLARPVPRPVPYATPVGGLYLCSSSTPPGGGVHGMCGFHAARAALRWLGQHRS